MWRWAISSDAGSGGSRGSNRVARALVASVAAALALAGPVRAKVFLTQEEALRLAFPDGSEVDRRTAFLTEEQAAAVERACGEPLRFRVVTSYAGSRGGAPAGTAYFDAHLVRTLPETIMVVVTPEGAIGRVDVLSFSEPEEYLPRDRWLAQLPGRRLEEDLSLRQGIRPITGATLSARAIVAAARRVLALHQVLSAPPAAARPVDPPGPRRERP